MSLVSHLKSRADFLHTVRAFFSARAITEVDTPILQSAPPIDAHIDIFEVPYSGDARWYLHSSPEFAMKRLLAKGIGDIYQLSHVFRKEERGDKHLPEFTMLEWYRCHIEEAAFLREVCELLSLFITPQRVRRYAYAEVMPTSCEAALRAHAIAIPSDTTSLEDLVWSCIVEPSFPKNELTIITDFPPGKAAFAKIEEGKAQRFEWYYGGYELANGYNELTDAEAYLKRMDTQNRQRIALGKSAYPIDMGFIRDIEAMPPCFGVAVGFDRLMMLALGAQRIDQVQFCTSG